jgi:hypothetical protein
VIEKKVQTKDGHAVILIGMNLIGQPGHIRPKGAVITTKATDPEETIGIIEVETVRTVVTGTTMVTAPTTVTVPIVAIVPITAIAPIIEAAAIPLIVQEDLGPTVETAIRETTVVKVIALIVVDGEIAKDLRAPTGGTRREEIAATVEETVAIDHSVETIPDSVVAEVEDIREETPVRVSVLVDTVAVAADTEEEVALNKEVDMVVLNKDAEEWILAMYVQNTPLLSKPCPKAQFV